MNSATAEYRDIAHGGMKTAQGIRNHGQPGSGLEPECQVSVQDGIIDSPIGLSKLWWERLWCHPQRHVAIDLQVVERTRRERGVAVLPPLFRFFVWSRERNSFETGTRNWILNWKWIHLIEIIRRKKEHDHAWKLDLELDLNLSADTEMKIEWIWSGNGMEMK